MRQALQRFAGSSKLRDAFATASLAIVFVLVWDLLIRIYRLPEYLMPSMSLVRKAFFENWRELLSNTWTTAQEAAAGLALGAGFGFICGVLFAHSRILERLFQPYLVALQAVPIVAIAPLLVIWFGSDTMGKIVLAAFISYFPVVVATTIGVGRIRAEYYELMQILSANRLQIFFKVRLPHSLPYIFSSLRVSASLSVIGAIVAEIAGANRGIGNRILVASYRTETAFMIAAIGCAASLGLLFYLCVRAVGDYCLRNHEYEYAKL